MQRHASGWRSRRRDTAVRAAGVASPVVTSAARCVAADRPRRLVAGRRRWRSALVRPRRSRRRRGPGPDRGRRAALAGGRRGPCGRRRWRRGQRSAGSIATDRRRRRHRAVRVGRADGPGPGATRRGRPAGPGRPEPPTGARGGPVDSVPCPLTIAVPIAPRPRRGAPDRRALGGRTRDRRRTRAGGRRRGRGGGLAGPAGAGRRPVHAGTRRASAAGRPDARLRDRGRPHRRRSPGPRSTSPRRPAVTAGGPDDRP